MQKLIRPLVSVAILVYFGSFIYAWSFMKELTQTFWGGILGGVAAGILFVTTLAARDIARENSNLALQEFGFAAFVVISLLLTSPDYPVGDPTDNFLREVLVVISTVPIWVATDRLREFWLYLRDLRNTRST